MPDYHVSYIWSQRPTRSTGWTENFWLTASDLNTAADLAGGLQGPSRIIHGAQGSLTDIRVSQLGGGRISRLIDVSTDPSIGVPSSDFPTTALLIQMTATSGKSTKQWLKGMWDVITSEGGRFTNANDFNKFFKKWSNLVVGTFSIRVLTTPVLRNINAIDVLTGTFTSPGHGFVANDRVRVTKVRPLPRNYANKVWRVASSTADTFTVAGWAPPVGYSANIGYAQAAKQVYTLETIARVDVLRITKKNVGRPFGALVGKSKPRH